MNPVLSVTTANFKYTLIQEADGRLHTLRHGEPWRDCTGDKLILTLAQDLEAARERIRELETGLGSVLASDIKAAEAEQLKSFYETKQKKTL